MNNKENITRVLPELQMGAHLWSPIFGNCTFVSKDDKDKTVRVISKNGTVADFGFDGKRYPTGECLLFPSEQMTDWERFFLPGDVVQRVGGDANAPAKLYFNQWVHDDYTTFIGRHYTEAGCWAIYKAHTEDYRKASKEDADQFHKASKEQQDEEERKALKQAQTFKPFEKVLVRDTPTDKWEPAFFSYKIEGRTMSTYMTFEGTDYYECIPYEGNEHLIFTDKSPVGYIDEGSEL